MELFVVRNIFSILTAKEIVKQYKIKNVHFLIPVNDLKLYHRLEKNLSNKTIVSLPTKDYIYPSIKKFFYLIKKIKIKDKEIKDFLTVNNYKKIYLSGLHDPFEQQLSFIGNQMNLEINLYEEGTNLYFYNLEQNKIKTFIKKCILYFFKNECSFYMQKKGEIKIKNVYCTLPKAYQFKNYQKLSKINLTFEIKNNRKIIENLLVTRPLSEDKLLDEKREIEIILNYLNKNNIKEITLKPHPRENEEKIKKIIEQAKLRQINIEIFKDETPLEKIIEDYDIKKMIGYETGSLVYLSELYDIKCDCLLKTVLKETNLSYFKNYYNFYSKNFKKINYV